MPPSTHDRLSWRVRHVLERLREKGALEGIERLADLSRGYLLFRRTEHGPMISATGHVRVVAEGKIRIGGRSFFMGGMIPTELVCHRDAELVIGEGADFNYGVSIEARTSIRIGSRSMFGSMVRVTDASKDRSAPIVIGDDVWIAHGAVIEPGVTIGDGSVVSAGSVVRHHVPPNSLAMGNPARPLPLAVSPAASSVG